MPIYEFYCSDNHTIYSFYARSLTLANRVPRCPDNADYRLEKRVSVFSVTGRAKEVAEDSLGGGLEGDDPAMERALASMEHEFARLDEENPDPRQLGHLMRRMSDVMGDQMPPAMEEMIARLEKGEDPDALDEEYGDLLDAEMESMGDGEVSPGSQKRARRQSPKRDPKVYEMIEFL